ISLRPVDPPQKLQAAFEDRGANNFKNINAPGLLVSSRWIHLALAMGRRDTRLYANGVLVGTFDSPQAFSRFRTTRHYYFGKSSYTSDPPLHGEMDELRVWVTARTGEQIRENMFQRLTGAEDGLAGLWNFDDPAHPGHDASPHGFNGTLRQDAQLSAVTLPTAGELVIPASLRGTLTDTDG